MLRKCRVSQSCRCMRASPICTKRFYVSIMLEALELVHVAEQQLHQQDPEPDAPLALSRYVQLAEEHVGHGRLVLPMPKVHITLAEMASRVLASVVAAPQTAFAASVILQPVKQLFERVNSEAAKLVTPPSGPRRSLLASAEQLLQGPSPLLTAADVLAQCPAHVAYLVASISAGIVVAVHFESSLLSERVSRLIPQLQQRCLTLLNDPAIAAQLQQRYLPPHMACSDLRPCAEELGHVVDGSSSLLLSYMRNMWKDRAHLHGRIGSLTSNQMLLPALSAAMEFPSRRQAPGLVRPEFVQHAVVTAYRVAAYLRDVIMLAIEAQHECPSLVWKATGLASTVAGVAASVLAFAQYDSHTNQRPLVIHGRLPGCMQYAAEAVRYLHLVAQHPAQLGRKTVVAALTSRTFQGVVPELMRLITWLSKPTTAIATASGVLTEALPALTLMAADVHIRPMLAAVGASGRGAAAAAAAAHGGSFLA